MGMMMPRERLRRGGTVTLANLEAGARVLLGGEPIAVKKPVLP